MPKPAFRFVGLAANVLGGMLASCNARLGRGAYGTVYLCEDKKSGEQAIGNVSHPIQKSFFLSPKPLLFCNKVKVRFEMICHATRRL